MEAAGEVPDGLHLLRLHQLAVEIPLLILGNLSLINIEAQDRDAACQEKEDPQGREHKARMLGCEGDRPVDDDGLPREQALWDTEAHQHAAPIMLEICC
jgi:hypothetical protein